MSDFLSNLVTRSLGATQVIQPRLPSLFEDAMPYALSPAIEQPDQTHSTSNRKGLRNSQTGPELPHADEHPHFAQQPASAPVNRDTESLPSHVQAESPRNAAYAAPVLQAADGASTQPNSLPGERRIERPEFRRNKGYAHDRIPPATVDHSGAHPQAFFPAKAADQRESALALNETIAAASSRSPQQAKDFAARSVAADPIQPRKADSAARAIATNEPPRRVHLEFARHIPPLSQARPAEPSIQVTIGRIEVRAASAPPPPAKEQKASSVMSLSDYLQRTRRGGQ